MTVTLRLGHFHSMHATGRVCVQDLEEGGITTGWMPQPTEVLFLKPPSKCLIATVHYFDSDQ
jgi:hypothetical protein